MLDSFRRCQPVFNALGDRYRQDIVVLLAEETRLNVSQITERIGLSRPAVSHHLKVLMQADLLAMERVSRENFYSLTLDAAMAEMALLLELTAESCA